MNKQTPLTLDTNTFVDSYSYSMISNFAECADITIIRSL